MKIGIIADTHDNLPKFDKAIKFFKRKRVDYVLHAGDFIAPFAAAKLNNLSCDFRGVFGNNDGETAGLTRVSAGRIGPSPLRISLDNRPIILVHDINTINPSAEQAQLIIYGHTHTPEIRRLDSAVLVNPGECGGWLSGRCSVSIIDTDTLKPITFYL